MVSILLYQDYGVNTAVERPQYNYYVTKNTISTARLKTTVSKLRTITIVPMLGCQYYGANAKVPVLRYQYNSTKTTVP